MKNRSIIVLSFFSFLTLTAREFRTPIPLLRHWLHEVECRTEQRDCWQINTWAGYYNRTAHDAYSCSSSTGSLSQLLFGRASFTARDIFCKDAVPNPFDILLSTQLTPRIRYKDQGAVLGLDIKRRVCDWIYMGVRLMLPIRSFSMRLEGDPGFGQGPRIDDFVSCRTIALNGRQFQSCAYRLDFLSRLPVDINEPGSRFKLVNYKNVQFPSMPITMSNQDVTDPAALNRQDRNPVTVLRNSTKMVPQQPLVLSIDEAQSLPALAGNGSGIVEGGRARFVTGTDYSPLGTDIATQEQLWVVNTINAAEEALVDPAAIIQDHVEQLLTCVGANTAQELLAQCGIRLCSQRSTGPGDLDAVGYSRFYWDEASFSTFLFGLRLPTGKRKNNPGNLLLQPLGNNGHTEIMLGTRTYWEPCSRLFLQGHAAYSFVLNRTERVAAPFVCAQVKNIGPCIPARIHWGYFLGHVEIGCNVLDTYDTCHNLIARVGYEAYVKQKDSIALPQSSAGDCAGRIQQLCASLLSRNTQATAHTLYGKVTYTYDWDRCTFGIFGGASGVIAGKNVPKDRAWYIGIECCI